MFISINEIRKIGLGLADGSITAEDLYNFFDNTPAPAETAPEECVAPEANDPVVLENQPVVPFVAKDEEQFSPRKLHVRIKHRVTGTPQVVVEEPTAEDTSESVAEPEQIVEDRPPEPVIVSPKPGKRFSLRVNAPIATDEE